MERWQKRVALVTGANSGIGYAIAKVFVKNGLKVVGVDLNLENIELLADELKGETGCLVSYRCDLRKDDQIEALFDFLAEKHGGVDVCVNNAAVLGLHPILKGSPAEWRDVLDVNVLAACHCSKLAVNMMIKNKVDDGHIINLASIHCHCYIPVHEQHFYRITKFAVRALAETLRYELIEAKSNIKVNNVSPGATLTDNLKHAGYDEKRQKELYSQEICILPEDIANSVLHVLSTPETVQIQEIIVSRSGRKY